MPQCQIANSTKSRQKVLVCHMDDDPDDFHLDIGDVFLGLGAWGERGVHTTTVFFHGVGTWPVVAVQ